MDATELLDIIRGGETSTMQLKQELDEDKVAAEMIAMSNSKERKLTDNAEIAVLFQQSGSLLADEMEVYGTSIDDIDEWLFAEYFKREFKRSFREKGLTYEEALKAKRVTRGGKATLAGLLFFGREPQAVKPALTVKRGRALTPSAFWKYRK